MRQHFNARATEKQGRAPRETHDLPGTRADAEDLSLVAAQALRHGRLDRARAAIDKLRANGIVADIREVMRP
jgi:hypothetical protein